MPALLLAGPDELVAVALPIGCMSREFILAGAMLAGGAYLLKSSPKRDIRGRVVLITGGGGGVGRAAAIAFAQRGARILLWDVSLAGLEASEAAVRAAVPGAHVQSSVVDLCSRHAVYKAAAVAQQLQWSGTAAEPVFCVVNNAGIVTGAPLLEIDDAHIIKTFEVNVLAHFWTVKAFLPAMLARNEGHIVTLASVAGLVGSASLTDYSSSKFAAVGFHEAIRAELTAMGAVAEGVHASLVCPAHIKTALFEGFKQPMGALVPSLTPEQVGDAMVAAVQESRAMTVLPRIINTTLVTKAMLPTRWTEVIYDITGMQKAMSGFDATHAKARLKLMEQQRSNREKQQAAPAPAPAQQDVSHAAHTLSRL